MQVFESLLLDCDAAVNYSNWNYFAGVGNDPRNRDFKTVTQGETYDEAGALIATWLPALAALPPHLRHRPWLRHDAAACKGEGDAITGECASAEAGAASTDQDAASELAHAGVTWEHQEYPDPIVDVATQIGKGPKKGRSK